MKKCMTCGKEFDANAHFCDICGTKLPEETYNNVGEDTVKAQPIHAAAVQPQHGQSADFQNQQYSERNHINAYNTVPAAGNSRGDFLTAPTHINVISVIGFVLAFLCVAFVWIPQLSIVVFPLAVISLVLCTIVKALRYNIIFAKVGFIVGLVISIISAIVFGIYFYENILY